MRHIPSLPSSQLLDAGIALRCSCNASEAETGEERTGGERPRSGPPGAGLARPRAAARSGGPLRAGSRGPPRPARKKTRRKLQVDIVGFFDITKAIKRVCRTGSSASVTTSARLGRQSTTISGIRSKRAMKELQAGRQLYSGADNGAQSEQCPMGPTARLAIELSEQCPCNPNLCGPKSPRRVAMHDAVTMPSRVASSAVAAALAPLRIAVTNPRYESSS